ncbi:hypothetical protein [Planomonospora parontospora]|uniref:hypothetical protein n=1 Tax=Planomonospora parontospora TaxID=58119 RepID=UPI00167054B5|nr:hypothetical protein [Planomonospora parontospora]GGL27954.1 hypothetical protein GCM10014719_31840 [Planomonospora parontospora subsp. antibiotica]GII16459.1 hypothetical protein Ppa05_31850 [Planomonospora parontospora subsp. antibiotica]
MFWLVHHCNRVPGTNAAENPSTFSFTAPAKGDLYDFDVTVRTSWSPVGRRRSGPDDDEHRHVQGRIRAEARTVTRKHLPLHPGEAEQAVNRALDNMLRGLADHGRRWKGGRWTAQAEVGLSTDMLRLHRDRARRLHDVETETAEARLRVDKARQLRVAWEDFLREAGRSRYSEFAMRLAEQPKEAARVVAEMLDKGEDTAAHFIDRLDKLAASYQRSNVYELVTGSDSALRDAMRALGLRVPPADSDPLITNGSGHP